MKQISVDFNEDISKKKSAETPKVEDLKDEENDEDEFAMFKKVNSVSHPFMNGELNKVNWRNWANTEDYDFKAIHKVENYPETN